MQVWLKNYFWYEFFCIINFCFGPFEIHKFKTNCSSLKIDTALPMGCSYLFYEMCVTLLHLVVLYTFFFVDLACKQLTMSFLRHVICSGLIIWQVS